MSAVGECLTPCVLEPKFKDETLRVNVEYPRVKKSIAKADQEDGYRYVLFPRIGAEAQKLVSYRSRVENVFSYLKGRGCFGGDSEARLPIRGQRRLQLRLLCTLIPLTALALTQMGVEMPKELLDDWFSADDDPPLNLAA